MLKIFVAAAAAILTIMNISTSAQNQIQTSAPPIAEANYRVFDGQGNPADLNAIAAAAGKVDAVFLGEQHDDAAAHFLEAEIFKDIWGFYSQKRKVALSMEMFERDEQIVLDEYLKNLITEKKFLDDSRPWANYQTDYRPLVEFAKEKNLAVIAANAPRRYVNMVSRNGRDSLNALSPEAKKWLAPLPFAEASDVYAAKFNGLMGQINGADKNHSPLLAAQSLWDATMAYSIAEHLKQNKNALVVHLNGSFHTENRLGIVEHLNRYDPQAKVLVVTMQSAADFQHFDKAKMTALGDFVILTNAKTKK